MPKDTLLVAGETRSSRRMLRRLRLRGSWSRWRRSTHHSVIFPTVQRNPTPVIWTLVVTRWKFRFRMKSRSASGCRWLRNLHRLRHCQPTTCHHCCLHSNKRSNNHIVLHPTPRRTLWPHLQHSARRRKRRHPPRNQLKQRHRSLI